MESKITESKIIKLVPMEKVVDLMAMSCKDHSLQRTEAQIIDAMLNAFPSALIQESKYLSYDDVVLFMDNWIKAVKTKDFNFLTMKRGKRWELPPVDEIIDSPEYLNQKTQIRPAIRRELLRLYEPGKYFPEVILTGGTGIGKDYISYLIYGITLMELYSYWNPQVEFGLAAGTSIILAIQSITKELAKQVTFNELVGTILVNSKFFREKFSWDRQVTSELRFPNNIYVRPFSGEDTSALGMAIFSACFPQDQEYVCADGSYSTFRDLKEDEILTSDGVDVFKTQPVKAVRTGCKELIRLWFGDEYIDCTPNQKFKGEDNEWIDAEQCSGIRLLSCDLPTLWEEGDLYGSTPKVSTQDDNEGVFSAISRCTNVQSGYGSERKEEKRNRPRKDNLPDLWNESCANKYHAPEKTPQWFDCERVQREISRCPDGYTEYKGKNSKKLCATHAGAAKMPKVQREVKGAWEKVVQGRCTIEGLERKVELRSRVPKALCSKTQRSRGQDAYGRKTSWRRSFNSTYAAGSLGRSECVGIEGKAVYKCEGRACTFSVKPRGHNSLLVRLLKYPLEVRGITYTLQHWRRGACVHPRLYDRGLVYRSKDRLFYEDVPENKCSNNGSSQNKAFSTLVRHDGKALQDYGHSVQLPELPKDKRDNVSRPSNKISTVICTKVERLIGTYSVFDIKEVKGTHTVIVPTKNKSIHLLAHNCANEIDYMNVVSKSKKAGGQEFNQAARIYKTLSRRIKGRFMQHGKVPGKMILISSTNKEGGFLHKRLQEVEAMKPEDREKVFIMKMSQWESFDGLDKYSPGIFLVEKGDGSKQSRIIESRDDAIDPEDVIEVPLDFLDEFEKDIDGAISDIAGEFVSGGRKKFIPYKEDMAKAVAVHKELNDNQQLFRQESIIFDKIVDPYNPDYSKIVNLDYIRSIIAPNVPFAGHIDYGFTGDGTGLGIGHVSSYKFLEKARVYNPQTNGYDLVENINLPIYHIDGIIQIKASSGSEVDIDFVEGLVHYLKEHINIQWMTFDSYESRASIQGFKKRGIISGVISTVSNREPYTELKNSIKTGRIHFPDSKILTKEIRELERLPDGKIDHPADGSKDCSDAVAGLIYMLMRGALKNSNRTTSSQRRAVSKNEKPVACTARRSRFSSI